MAANSLARRRHGRARCGSSIRDGIVVQLLAQQRDASSRRSHNGPLAIYHVRRLLVDWVEIKMKGFLFREPSRTRLFEEREDGGSLPFHRPAARAGPSGSVVPFNKTPPARRHPTPEATLSAAPDSPRVHVAGFVRLVHRRRCACSRRVGRSGTLGAWTGSSPGRCPG